MGKGGTKGSGDDEPDCTAEWKPLWDGVRRPIKGRRVNETARAYVEYREVPAKPSDTKPRFEIRCTQCHGRSKGGRRVLKNNSIEDAFNVTTWTAHFVESCDYISPEIKGSLTAVSKSKKLKRSDGTAALTSGGMSHAPEGSFVRVSALNPQEAEEEKVLLRFRELCEKNAAVAESEGYRKDQLKKNSAVIFLANCLKLRIPAIKTIVDEVDELDHSGLIDEEKCIYIVHQLLSGGPAPVPDGADPAGEHAAEAEADAAEPSADMAEGGGHMVAEPATHENETGVEQPSEAAHVES
ncbi:hypothetical protein FVE85_5564 [Porphyridium purpureum]|uniref:Uncharacterized protein n=1 Tax=Porphyridium purpureum TaxID=35688 RepID=A0A5J4Z239_PORPP|nr:hypothetical protein FVE85_5564 [Porphyridium purpureum]|eukprot:POR3272..scf295_1